MTTTDTTNQDIKFASDGLPIFRATIDGDEVSFICPQCHRKVVFEGKHNLCRCWPNGMYWDIRAWGCVVMFRRSKGVDDESYNG